MSRRRASLLLLTIAMIVLLLPVFGQAQIDALTVKGVAATDLSGIPKTSFSPGDTIRYTVSYSASGFSFLRARGTVAFTGAPQKKLPRQYKTGSGDYTISWDSVIPAQALGTATVTIRYFSLPGGFGTSFATFIVAENPPLPPASYVGTSLCIACHGSFSKSIVDAYNESGHHFALNAVSASAPVYPGIAPGVPQPPATFPWPDILYVTGGYGWGAQFVNQDGYILTNGVNGVDSQYNLPDAFLNLPGQFVPYEVIQSAAKPFTCGACHTTGYSAAGSQGGKPGIVGTWQEPGVGCEACHGPGSNHVANPSVVKPPNDPAQACADCHTRDNKAVVEASDGLVLDQQQSDELQAGIKSFFKCVSCHNPHASAHYDQSAQGTAIVQACTNCHKDKTVGLGMGFLKCTDCHMPFAVKSGASIRFKDPSGLDVKLGDMRSHVFSINPDAASPSEMFSPDGSSLATGSDGKAKGLTLDFMCLSCHRQGGYAATAYSFEQVKGLAPYVHGSVPAKNGYIGSALCIACHSGRNKDITDAYSASGHHYALNKAGAAAPVYPQFTPGVSQPPAGLQWTDITYVTGGYGWKANFLNTSGYLITNGTNKIDSQYNLPDSFISTPGQFVPYETAQTAPKAFDCGSCHATGYTAQGNQNSLAGIKGTWNEDGVGCEACHGPGEEHLNNPFGVKPPNDPKQACGTCHIRDNAAVLEAEGGLIQSQQQAEELKAGAMSFLTCDSCHDAHASAHYDQSAPGIGIVTECLSCHPGKTIGLGMGFLKCTDCHMPYAVKSGANISYQDPGGLALKIGDVRSHLFTINADAASPADMFTADGTAVVVDANGKAKGLTLDFVCLACHRPGGLANTTYTYEQVKNLAGSVH